MKIIVTGGAGFIGANFIYYQLKNHPEDELICLDALTYAGNLETLEEAMQSKRFRFVKGDISNRAFVFSLVKLIACVCLPSIVTRISYAASLYSFRLISSAVTIISWLSALKYSVSLSLSAPAAALQNASAALNAQIARFFIVSPSFVSGFALFTGSIL